jgi:hypothetical protein
MLIVKRQNGFKVVRKIEHFNPMITLTVIPLRAAHCNIKIVKKGFGNILSPVFL